MWLDYYLLFKLDWNNLGLELKYCGVIKPLDIRRSYYWNFWI